MARPLRVLYPGALYHIVSRGNEAKAIFIDKQDYEKFFQYLKDVSIKYRIKLHSYVLMNNHYHLLLETPLGNIVDAMHYLNSSYTTYFNARHERIGHLFQGRYKSFLVEKDRYFLAVSRYIHLNPVRKNLVKKPQDYQWSSYKYFTEQIKSPNFIYVEFILSMFTENFEKARILYKKFVEDNIGKEVEVITNNTYAGLIIGSEKFKDWVGETFLKKKNLNRELPQIQQLKKMPSIEEIDRLVKENVQDNKLSQKIAIYLTKKFTGRKLYQIAEHFGCTSDASVSQIFRRIENTRKTNKNLNLIVGNLENLLNVEV